MKDLARFPVWTLASAIFQRALKPQSYYTCSVLMDVWKESKILPNSISSTQRNSPLHQIGSLAWHHVQHNRWHLSAGFEGLLIFTDMQSVRLLFGWEQERSSVLVKTHLSGTASLLLCTWSPIHLHLLSICGPFLWQRLALSKLPFARSYHNVGCEGRGGII